MNVYDWLEQVKKLDFMIQNLVEESEQLRCIYPKISYSNDGGSRPYSPSDQVARTAMKLIELETEITEAIDRYVDYKLNVIRQLEKLPAIEYQTLYLYYIKYKTWADVASELGYSEVQIYRIKNKAIDNLSNLIKDDIQCYTITML